MGRKLRTTLPMDPKRLIPHQVDTEVLKKKKEKRKESHKKNYDKHHGVRSEAELQTGDTVWIKDLRAWGRIVEKAKAPRSYIVDTSRGQFRRNSFHLIPMQQDEGHLDVSPTVKFTRKIPERGKKQMRQNPSPKMQRESPRLKMKKIPKRNQRYAGAAELDILQEG